MYRLKTSGLNLKTEELGAERIDAFRNLQRLLELSAEVKKALTEKESAIFRYAERLKLFSAVCKENKDYFHITHGDAGGNCILNENQLFLVDWDSVMLAPIERDTWIFICSENDMEQIHSILTENGIDYVMEQNRLCYYYYDFFFYYLKSITEAKSKEQKEEIIKGLIWISDRLLDI